MTTTTTDGLPRVQLALNVPDLEAAIGFYNAIFAAEPAKIRPGYANYALTNPTLKLVLIENPGATERLNHLGVEVASTAEVAAHARRLGEQLPVRIEEETSCCYAVQDKAWVNGPDRTDWEFYTVLGEADGMNCEADPATGEACCPGVAAEAVLAH